MLFYNNFNRLSNFTQLFDKSGKFLIDMLSRHICEK